MAATAKVIEASLSPQGYQLITLQLRYPRFVHSEFMTHRVFSRNASSSRAIPVSKMIEQVRTDPAMPVHWGKNQPGMQAREELDGRALVDAQAWWKYAAKQAADTAEQMMQVGLHKQVANRILEPFQYISVIVTATDWDNFFELRDHEDADPNIRALAVAMREAMYGTQLICRDHNWSHESSWHLPYVTKEERAANRFDPMFLAKLSAARCARVSYLTHEGKVPSVAEDLALYERLAGSSPIHASPLEHQARPEAGGMRCANFQGWRQFRVVMGH